MAYDKQLIKKSENLSEWYNKVVLLAELADYGPAKGTMIFRPYGYGLWELLQAALDKKIKAMDVPNSYFPLLIPESLLKKEEGHLEGFSPELAVVTIGGGEELKEKLVVRPTSETIIYDAFNRWIQSYRDLPMKLNQWSNVVRWEKRTYLFLRTSEFLWQEGHTAHASHGESWAMVEQAMAAYTSLYRDYLALPGYMGKKSRSETFAGADVTLTYETLMPEGKALQSCTSHDLGQNFSKAFDVGFQSKDGKREFVWQTSWGLSTRSLGGLIMAHGDDSGLRIPPKLAPVQVAILLVRIEKDSLRYCRDIAKQLAGKGIRAQVDERDGESIGFKINRWELRGAPVRLEVGPKEMEAQAVTVARRDSTEKVSLELGTLNAKIEAMLVEIQQSMLDVAQKHLEDNTHTVNDWDEFKKHMEGDKGFLRALWCEDDDCEAKIKEETKATTRCLELNAKDEAGVCIHCGKPARHRWLFAQAY